MNLDYPVLLNNSCVRAILRVIREGESSQLPIAYRMRYGGAGNRAVMIDDLTKHPRIFERTPTGEKSSAAGAYQFTATTWDEVCNRYSLPDDFSPYSQDCHAVALLDHIGALHPTLDGDFDTAIRKCSGRWASLPGSPLNDGGSKMSWSRAHDVYNLYLDAPIDTQPAAPIEERSTNMDPFSLIAVFGPIIANLIPQVAKLFDKKTETPEKIAAAQKVIETVVQSTGAVNAQEAVQKMQADPAVLKAATVAVVSQPDIMAILEVGGGIAKAREFDLAQQAQALPFWKTSAVFWISMTLLPMVVWYVGSSIVGGVDIPADWPWGVQLLLKLFGTAWSLDARSGLANLVVGLVLGGICGVYFGVSVTQAKQQQAQLNGERQ